MRELSYAASLAPSTIKEYSRIYGGFQWFITVFELDPNDVTSAEYYASYLGTLVQAYKSKKVKPALQYFADLEGRKLYISDSYSRVVKGLTKIWTISDRKKLKRDPVSANHISNYVNNGDLGDNFLFKLTCAILVVGFRLFARPGDLCELSWSCVSFQKNGNLKFDLSGHKTDFYLLEKPIPVEPNLEDPLVCPIRLLKTYMDEVSSFKEKDSPLFSFRDNKYLTTGVISKIIQGAMKVVDPEVHASGHSLRIGAATESIIKGVPLESIKVAGRWKSEESCGRYMRAEGLAVNNFTSTLFSSHNNTH